MPIFSGVRAAGAAGVRDRRCSPSRSSCRPSRWPRRSRRPRPGSATPRRPRAHAATSAMRRDGHGPRHARRPDPHWPPRSRAIGNGRLFRSQCTPTPYRDGRPDRLSGPTGHEPRARVLRQRHHRRRFRPSRTMVGQATSCRISADTRRLLDPGPLRRRQGRRAALRERVLPRRRRPRPDRGLPGRPEGHRRRQPRHHRPVHVDPRLEVREPDRGAPVGTARGVPAERRPGPRSCGSRTAGTATTSTRPTTRATSRTGPRRLPRGYPGGHCRAFRSTSTTGCRA